MEEEGEAAVMDAALIGAAQRVEHYEIAGYGCARTHARLLGRDQAAELLQETLDEEAEADKKLTELAESIINVEAQQGDSEDQESVTSEMEEEPEETKTRNGSRGRRNRAAQS